MYKHISEGFDPTQFDRLNVQVRDIQDQSIVKPTFTITDLERRVKVGWLWENWLPTGTLTLLVGKARIGKSALGLAMANIVVTGCNWPDGQLNDNPGLAVWVETEGAQAILLDRANKWGMSLEKVLLPCTTNDPLDKLWLDEHSEPDWEALEREAY